MIEKPYLDDVCRIGQGAACCRYLVGTPDKGTQCAKLTTLRDVIDARVGRMTAQGDNCARLAGRLISGPKRLALARGAPFRPCDQRMAQRTPT